MISFLKQILIAIIFFFQGVLFAQVTFNPDDLNAIARGDRRAGRIELSRASGTATSAYSVPYYNCFWIIDPAVREITGRVTVYFIPKQAGFDSLVLDMYQTLLAGTVVYHGFPFSTYYQASDQLVLKFSSPRAQNVLDSVTVYYNGVPPSDGFGTFETGTHNGAPILWTLSEPYGSSNWWPCKNGLTDKADSIDIYISTPSAYKTASNGILVSAEVAGTNTIYHWKHRYPIAAYLVGIAVTNYVRYDHQVPFQGDTLEVVNFVYPEDSATAVLETRLIIPMIQLFDSLFGIYPFQREKYGHAQFGWGGGMEHQTMTFVTNFQFELIAHELAHSWFGDKVTCGSWTDIWLNEGTATYLTALCYEFLETDLFVRFREDRIKKITREAGGSVYCADTTNIDRIFDSRLSYAKGGMILHQLRCITGDSVFFAALNNYLDDFSLAYGFARTADLISHFESSYGHDLGWYFNEWFTGEGYPQYQVNWIQTGDTVAFTLKQTQSVPTASFFELPVELKLKNQDHDTLIRVNNTFSGEMFRVKIPFQVDSLFFDPRYQIISKNNTVNAVNEHSLQPEMLVSPNPACDHVTFHWGAQTAMGHGSIRIMDSSGRMVNEVLTVAVSKEMTLDTRNYSPGLYFYLVSWQNYYTTGKFIIVH